MIRAEQIEKAADLYSKVWWDRDDAVERIKNKTFIRGAEWADEHPHWHSIADCDLPSIGMTVVSYKAGRLRPYWVEYIESEYLLNVLKNDSDYWMELIMPNKGE